MNGARIVLANSPTPGRCRTKNKNSVSDATGDLCASQQPCSLPCQRWEPVSGSFLTHYALSQDLLLVHTGTNRARVKKLLFLIINISIRVRRTAR